MKRLPAGILIASLFAAMITSCVITDDEESDSPTLDVTQGMYALSFPSVSDMKYANVLRQSCADEDFSSEITTRNIGQVIPKDTSSLPASFIFFDNYTNSEYYYRYYIRYYNGVYYTYTSTTASHLGLSDNEAELDASGSFSLVLNYLTGEFTLTLNDDLEIPRDENDDEDSGFSELDIVLSAVEKNITRPFTFFSAAETDYESYSVSAETGWDMQKLLTAEFLDTPLVYLGIIAIAPYEDATTSSGTYDYYYWTSLCEGVTIKISGTDSSGKEMTYNSDSKFTVPSISRGSNDYDFSTD